MSKKSEKKPIVMYTEDDLIEKVDAFAKKTKRSRTAAAEILLRAGLIAVERPLFMLLDDPLATRGCG